MHQLAQTSDGPLHQPSPLPGLAQTSDGSLHQLAQTSVGPLHQLAQTSVGPLHQLAQTSDGSRAAPEEERHGARARVAADGGADGEDLHLAVHLGETVLHKRGQRLGVLEARGLRDVDLVGVVHAVLGVAQHLVIRREGGALLGADLLARLQGAVGRHVEQRADIEQPADEAGRLAHAAAADVEGEVGGEEPVLHVGAVLLGPVGEFAQRQAVVAQVSEAVHEQAVARGGAEGVDHDDVALGHLLSEQLGRLARGVVRARDARRERHMQDVLSGGEDRAEMLEVLAHRDLRGLGVSTFEHLGVDGLGGVGLAEVVLAGDAVKLIVEVHVRNAAAVEVLRGGIDGRAAAQNVICHGVPSFLVPSYHTHVDRAMHAVPSYHTHVDRAMHAASETESKKQTLRAD